MSWNISDVIMRFLKKLIISVLVYSAIYLPFVVVMQALSGGDYTAAYSVGGIISTVELALASIIKVAENKAEKLQTKEKNNEQDKLEAEAVEPKVLGGTGGICDGSDDSI